MFTPSGENELSRKVMAMYFVRQLNGRRELAESQRLRAQVFCFEKGFIPESRLVKGRDVDQYDAESFHIGAYNEFGDLIGCCRIILPDATLQIEEEFGIEIPEPSVEVSRLTVAPEHRNHVAMLGLCRRVCAEVENLGVNRMYAILERPLLSSLMYFGFPFDVLGEQQQTSYGTFDYPTLCPLDGVVEGMEKADAKRDNHRVAPFFQNSFRDGDVVDSEKLRPVPV